jgi:dTDP-4-dehydrorhamnose reductase
VIWLIGHTGMLGNELSLLLSSSGIEHFGTGREFDITELGALREAVVGRAIQWIVNCAAYTDVDRAEEEEGQARRINAAGAGTIAIVARELGAKLIHVSTDYVFSGEGRSPYLEDDQPAPAGAYGRTKAEGEALVREACERHFIVRTAWLYGRYGKNFVYTMLRLMAEKGEVGVVADQRGSPTWAKDLAVALLRMIESDSQAYGNYHFTDEGEASWFDFACEIHRLGRESGILAKDAVVRALTTAEYTSKVKRPGYSVLSKDKTKRLLGLHPPAWQDSLKLFISDLAENGVPTV